MSLKILYLLRHAKAVPAAGAPDDHERPLNPQGEEDARRMGRYLHERGMAPKRVLCSTALRTRQTLHGLEAATGPLDARFEPRLYLASLQEALRLAAQAMEEAESVMLIGHNPALHQLALYLASEGKDSDIKELACHFSPCALAEIRLPAGWGDLPSGSGTLQRLVIGSALESVVGAPAG